MLSPTIHWNGTSAGALLDQVTDARHALRLAMEALEGAAPNGRDYYPQGDSAIHAALREHASRMDRLRSVGAELDALAEKISDAIDGRLRDYRDGNQ